MLRNRHDEWPSSEQEIQLLACRSMMRDEPLIPVKVVHEMEKLEKTRLYGPFDLETVAWIAKMLAQCPRLVTLGQDEVGEYVQY